MNRLGAVGEILGGVAKKKKKISFGTKTISVKYILVNLVNLDIFNPNVKIGI